MADLRAIGMWDPNPNCQRDRFINFSVNVDLTLGLQQATARALWHFRVLSSRALLNRRMDCGRLSYFGID
jgi:hypothetical protein